MKLTKAVISKNIAQVKELLSAGADPNECIGETLIRPLHFAVYADMFEVVEILLEAGADMLAKTIDGETPLDIAKMKKNKKMLQLLSA